MGAFGGAPVAAACGLVIAPACPAITATMAPTGATSPAATRISASTPVVVEGTSIDTLSVSISNRLSPGFTASPAALYHLVILPSATVSPSCGISTSISPDPCNSLDPFPDDVLRAADRTEDQPVALEPVLPHGVDFSIGAEIAFAMMRHRAGLFVDRIGAEIGKELRHGRARPFLLRRNHLHRHVARPIIYDDPRRILSAVLAQLAVIRGADITPRALQAAGDCS